MTVTRPSSPAPTMDFSIISPPSPDPDSNVFAYFPPRTRRFHTIHGLPSSSRNNSYPSKSMRTIFPRLWDALSSPARKGKGRSGPSYDFEGYYSYADLPPLDGEEGELIDDEACFMDAEGPTSIGIDIIGKLPPELSIQLFRLLDLRSILASQVVSKTWHTLADDNAVWRDLFFRRQGWTINLTRATARGWSAPEQFILPTEDYFSNYAFNGSTRLSVPTNVHSRSPSPSPEGTPLFVTPAPSSPAILFPSPFSEELPSSQPSLTPPSADAPLTLPWRSLYQTRLTLDMRWASPSYHPRATRLAGHEDSVYCLEFDSARIVTGSRDRTVRVWRISDGKCIGTFRGHTGSVLCLKFENEWDVQASDEVGEEGLLVEGNRRGKKGFMVSGSSDRTVCVWDMWVTEDGQVEAEVRAVLKGHQGGVLDLRIDQQWIVSCSKDALIRVWNRQTLEHHRTLCGHEGPVNAVGLQHGRIVSASGDGKMMLWDIASGERLRVFEGHERGLACIEFKDDYIVSGSNDCRIKIWSASTGECLKTLVGHEALVRALAFDPIDGRLVSASYDKTVKVWDWRSGRMVRQFRQQHSSHIFDVKFDVRRIVSTSHDQRIVVLDFAEDLDTALFL
ncbi:WD40-repeat-containing domain protein [Amylostereum chailletii]|nr:WD40-repeat-containing domain protein [Amylostereum chailletii]